jgi:hypothetical protein
VAVAALRVFSASKEMLSKPERRFSENTGKSSTDSPQRENGLGASFPPSCTARAGYGFATLCLDSAFR